MAQNPIAGEKAPAGSEVLLILDYPAEDLFETPVEDSAPTD